MGRDYWAPLIDFIRGTLLAAGTIDPADLDRVLVTDSIEQAIDHIKGVALGEFGLRYLPQPGAPSLVAWGVSARRHACEAAMQPAARPLSGSGGWTLEAGRGTLDPHER